MEDFSKITAPLIQLTHKNIKYEWSDAYEHSFQELKKRLVLAPVLTLPTAGKEFIVYCNDLIHGLDCMLI